MGFCGFTISSDQTVMLSHLLRVWLSQNGGKQRMSKKNDVEDSLKTHTPCTHTHTYTHIHTRTRTHEHKHAHTTHTHIDSPPPTHTHEQTCCNRFHAVPMWTLTFYSTASRATTGERLFSQQLGALAPEREKVPECSTVDLPAVAL